MLFVTIQGTDASSKTTMLWLFLQECDSCRSCQHQTWNPSSHAKTWSVSSQIFSSMYTWMLLLCQLARVLRVQSLSSACQGARLGRILLHCLCICILHLQGMIFQSEIVHFLMRKSMKSLICEVCTLLQTLLCITYLYHMSSKFARYLQCEMWLIWKHPTSKRKEKWKITHILSREATGILVWFMKYDYAHESGQ